MTAPGEGEAPLRIVYIAGAQHCGSTMLDAILSSAPGAQGLGEMGGFHRYRDAGECDCRRPAATCGPCASVVTDLAGTGALDELHRLGPVPLKERRAYWTLAGGRRRAGYARLADAMFSSVAAATGAAVLVDSSKNVGRAAALVHESAHDVRVVHLVRDGRAYLRSKRGRAAADHRRFLAPVSLGVWAAKNLAIGTLLRRRAGSGRYLLCRYEDLMAAPEQELARIGGFAGLDTAGLAAAATGVGVARHHLYEPRRRLDYRRVRLDPARLRTPRLNWTHNLAYWLGGGFVSRRWGYDRTQSHLGTEGPVRPRP